MTITQLASAALRAWAAFLDSIGAAWFDWKTALERSVAFHDDAMHVLAGVILQLAAAVLLRTSLARAGPWLAVLALELLNEWSDLRQDLWPPNARSAQVGEGIKDLLLTLALPTLLLAIARWHPRLLVGSRG